MSPPQCKETTQQKQVYLSCNLEQRRHLKLTSKKNQGMYTRRAWTDLRHLRHVAHGTGTVQLVSALPVRLYETKVRVKDPPMVLAMKTSLPELSGL